MILLLKECANIESFSNRMASVALIACCLVHILGGNHPRQDATANLLNMLMLSVDVENKICPGIEFLLTGFPKVLRYFLMCVTDLYILHKRVLNANERF